MLVESEYSIIKIERVNNRRMWREEIKFISHDDCFNNIVVIGLRVQNLATYSHTRKHIMRKRSSRLLLSSSARP